VSPTQKITVGPGYQLPFARKVRAETGATTMAVGMITDPLEANRIVAEGEADLVALARGMLYNPRWGWHAAAALGAQVNAPRQYWRCQPAAHPNLFAGSSNRQR
jgi:2,4-dienoyl-CoA reductase-like NADH-dependent reductase (Old Yellow Enzyme family)